MNTDKKIAVIAERLTGSEAGECLRGRVEPVMKGDIEQLKAGSVIDIMVMPAGTHTCNFGGANSKLAKRTVTVDASAAVNLQEQLQAVNAGREGKQRAFFDFDHEEKGPASGWPTKFFWTEPQGGLPGGVFARTELSLAGAEAITGKNYRGFSPQFWATKTKPAKVIAGPDLCMGSFVNDPAFYENEPLWARHQSPGSDEPGATGAQSRETETDENQMKDKIVELQSTIKNLESEVQQLKAKAAANANDELAAERLKGKQAELRATAAELEAEQLKAKDQERRETFAKNEVDGAVKDGRIGAKDEKLQAKFRKLIEEDESNIVLLAAMPKNPALAGEKLTASATAAAGERLQAKEGPERIIQALGERIQASRGLGKVMGYDSRAHQQAKEEARKMEYLFAKEVSRNAEVLNMPLYALGECLRGTAAEDTLGTLSGTLVMQRTLEFFRINYPLFKAIYTDFSDVPAMLSQTIDTRVVSKPAVQTYNNALGADGRPAGWDTASPATTTSKTISLDEHVGVPVVFGANALAKTIRRLFDEQAPAMAYALASYFVAKLYAKMTAANYNGYAAVNGAKVPVAYVTYAKGVLDFARSAFVDLNMIFNPNEVPLHDRAVLLNSQYYAAAGKDPSLVTFWAGQRNPEIITEGELPKMSKFVPIEAPDFPVTNNRVGFAFQKTAIGAISRIPQDYSKVLPGASYGNVTMISDPETGMSVMLVEYVNHTGGYAEMRMETMIGADVMDKRGGLVITSQ